MSLLSDIDDAYDDIRDTVDDIGDVVDDVGTIVGGGGGGGSGPSTSDIVSSLDSLAKVTVFLRSPAVQAVAALGAAYILYRIVR